MTSKEIVAMAMNLQRPERTPVMCQMANGHTIINTGVHPIDYFTDNELWADCLVRMRELYDFDGILCHKPGRVHGIMNLVERTDYDGETPTLFMSDGSRIECTRDDDAYYKPSAEFARPTMDELDLENLLSWAPESFVAFQASKATLPITDPEGFEDHVFATLDRVIDRVGDDYSVHGEVRAPFDHFLNILGMEEGLMALLDVQTFLLHHSAHLRQYIQQKSLLLPLLKNQYQLNLYSKEETLNDILNIPLCKLYILAGLMLCQMSLLFHQRTIHV